MADRETIKRYMRQISEDAERFAEINDMSGTPGRYGLQSLGNVMSRKPTGTGFSEEDPGTSDWNLEAGDGTSSPYGNDSRTRVETRRERDVTREVSEALGHELSVQRRMRGL